MANSMGSLYIAAAGIRTSQQGINTTANNLANVNTTGYVRQQVLYTDENYITFSNAAISQQQAGLGVSIGDVIHARDIFLDKSYRTEYGREAFYASYYEALDEIQTLLQEMEGEQFQEGINNFWTAIQTLADDPSDSVYQNLVVQKASLFLSRGQAVYEGLKNYQSNINTQIQDDVTRINEIFKQMYTLNKQIQQIEAGGQETAMTARDTRDLLLDELAGYGRVEYSEDAFGIVSVKFEGTMAVDEVRYFSMDLYRDGATGYLTPYWPHLSDVTKEEYEFVVDLSTEISSNLNTDIGELKALLAARGDKHAVYSDLLYDSNGDALSADEFLDTIGLSCMETSEAELDTLIHAIVTGINDALCPNITAEEAGLVSGTDSLYITDATTGSTYEITASTKILDADNCYVGVDGKLPPQELFVRTGCERYTTVTDASGNTYYIFNEEDLTDTSEMYTTMSLSINENLQIQPSLLAGFAQNGEVAYGIGDTLTALWEEAGLVLNPTDTEKVTYTNYYTKMINELATNGNVFYSTAQSLDSTVLAVSNQRQQVIGVSSDEELESLIKFQNAYNAASRYMTVISEMIELLVTQL